MDGFDRQPNIPRREVLEYVEVPFRRPFHFLIPLVLIVGAAVLMSFMLPKKYRSGSLILVEQEPVPESFVPRLAGGSDRNRSKGNSKLFTLKQVDRRPSSLSIQYRCQMLIQINERSHVLKNQ